jgi:hypothetical protein
MACSRVAARRFRIMMAEHAGRKSNMNDLKNKQANISRGSKIVQKD